MQYRLLRKIVAKICEMNCPRCQTPFTMEEVDIVDICDEEGILEVACRHCEARTAIEFNVVQPKVTIEGTTNEISKEEVQKLKQRLRDHKGSLRELFKNDDQKKPGH